MKRFKLHGKAANWVNGLRMSALNLRIFAEETSIFIPSDKRMYVSVANNIFHVDDTRREIIKGEISDTDKDAILTSIKTSTPDFLLTLEDKVVGYANLCNRHGHRTATDTTEDADTTEEEPIDIDIDEIVDGATLTLLIVPATATAPAHKRTGTYIVKQTITIEVEEEVTAESKEDAVENASDLLSKVEDFLDENYGDSHLLPYVTYRTRNYITTTEEVEE
jgi:hypothetical protein